MMQTASAICPTCIYVHHSLDGCAIGGQIALRRRRSALTVSEKAHAPVSTAQYVRDALEVTRDVGHERPMTGERLEEVLKLLGWSRRHLAKRLTAGTTTVDQWATNKASVPKPVANWLEALATVVSAMPPPSPSVWRRREPTWPPDAA